MIHIGIFGITGYTGYELARWLKRHPQAEVVWAVSESAAGKRLADVVPGALDMPLITTEQADWNAVDVIFTALPHGVAAQTARLAQQHGVKVIDLSADLRLDSVESYKQWYGGEHHAPELINAPYGLPELNRAKLVDAAVIANPGCYPTSVLLGLAPIVEHDWQFANQPIIVNSASGVSGAGRGLKPNLHFVEANENYSAYNIGRTHRHVGEIEQELNKLAHDPVNLIFAPHLLPVQRGILSTMYVHVQPNLDLQTIHAAYSERYANEPFVRVLPTGKTTQLSHVVHTNQCAIGMTLAQQGLVIITSAIDNLLKGAAGQAIQNMNIMFGLDETIGLI